MLDGGLQKGELIEYLTQHVGCLRADIDALFRELDANHDGVISKFEFMRGFEKFRADVLKARVKGIEHQRTVNRIMQATSSNLSSTNKGSGGKSLKKPDNAGFQVGSGLPKQGVVLNGALKGRDAQPALVIGRHCVTERDSAPVRYNGIV